MTVLPLWGRDLAELLAPSGPRRQPMCGFEESYADIIDYIIRCTWRIWEGRGIDLIRTHYAEDCPVHTMTGTVRGVQPVIDGTRAVLEAFPDRTLVGEAVIWSGDEEAGYLSSHRITSHATHLGPNEYGEPTGRRIDFTTIADCLCRENRIVEEWLVRDHAAIVRKLGLDVAAFAAVQASQDRQVGPSEWRQEAMQAIRDKAAAGTAASGAPYPSTDPQEFALAWFAAMLQGFADDGARQFYAPFARAWFPDERAALGHSAIARRQRQLLDPFEDLAASCEHIGAVREGPYDDIAVRWLLTGRHGRHGLYGPATGRHAYMLAVTHLRVLDGAIVEQWTIFDELALRRQLAGGL
jgi:predicted ester cyclase